MLGRKALLSLFKKNNKLHLLVFHVCSGMCTHVRGQTIVCGCQFSPSTMWIPSCYLDLQVDHMTFYPQSLAHPLALSKTGLSEEAESPSHGKFRQTPPGQVDN